jgi:hypothetical protein
MAAATKNSCYSDALPPGYVLVKSSDFTTPSGPSKASKDDSPAKGSGSLEEKKSSVSLARPRLLRQNGRMGGRRLAAKPVRQMIALSGTVNSSAATALAVSIGVNPSTAGDWSNLIGLFDEVRVVSSKIHFRFDTSAVSAIDVSCVGAYDPIEGSALASLANALQYPVHHLSAQPAGPTASSAHPSAFTSNGYYSMAAKVYMDPTRNTTSTAITNGWMSTSDASDIWGYWKFLCEPASSSVVLKLTYHMEIVCDFRSRQ